MFLSFSNLRTRITRKLAVLRQSGFSAEIILAVSVGVLAATGAVLFRFLIDWVQSLAMEDGARLLSFLGEYYIILVPAIGGLLVGPIIYYGAREAKGHGVPEVMAAVAINGGRIRPIVALVKALASSICIGTGGAVGREGPIVQIGAALGSTVAQALKLSERRIRTLLACGAASGIAVTFNAPIAGVIFALEIILGEFSTVNFSTIVVSAVTASAIGHAILGDSPAFLVPKYTLVSHWELLFYVVLGIASAVVGVAFIRSIYASEDSFEKLKIPEYIKPAVGGLLIGAIALYFPEVLGVGYQTMEKALHSELSYSLVFLLIPLKLLATSLTLGSGGSGGVFAPSLYIGGMLGAAIGIIVNALFPSISADPGAYSLVGMAALFAATARAPITSVIILFEMTNNYRIILPLMLATVISTFLSEIIHEESIYTLKLTRKGIRMPAGRNLDLMDLITAQEIMTVNPDTISFDMTLPELLKSFEQTHHHGYPVLNENGELLGIVSISDVERMIEKENFEKMTAGEIATTNLITVYPDETMSVAIERMARQELSRLPVVARDNPRSLVGLVRRADLSKAYLLSRNQRTERQFRVRHLLPRNTKGTSLVEFRLLPDNKAVGRSVQELNIPQDCLLVALHRDEQLIVPHGSTRLAAGDVVTIYGSAEACQRLRQMSLIAE